MNLGIVERCLEDIVPGFVLASLMCGVSALHADESSITYANWRKGGIENVECKIEGVEARWRTVSLRTDSWWRGSQGVHYLEAGSFYDADTGGTYNRRVKAEVYEFLGNFELYWYYGISGADLASALYNAYINTPSLPYGIWQNGAGLQLFGYAGLSIDGCNWQYEWSN